VLRVVAAAALVSACTSRPTRNDDLVTVPDAAREGWLQRVTPAEYDAPRREAIEEAFKVEPTDDEYRIGPGDKVSIKVFGADELSGEHLVGPDGRIGVPFTGAIALRGATRNEAAAKLLEAFQPRYRNELSISVDVDQYANHKIYVFGRVSKSGQTELDGPRTLLSALANAGGINRGQEDEEPPFRCSIIRGNDRVINVDLYDLLERGDLRLNVPLRAGDVVYVSDYDEPAVHVLGEVENAGRIALRPGMGMMEAIAKAGGPTDDADLRYVYLVRNSDVVEARGPFRADFLKLLEEGDLSNDCVLRDGDVVFVDRSALGDMGYVLAQVSTLVNAASLATILVQGSR
jgi:polysaccharide export outer membrane protein